LMGLSQSTGGLHHAMSSQCAPAARKVRAAISLSRVFSRTPEIRGDSSAGSSINGGRISIGARDCALLCGMVVRYRQEERSRGGDTDGNTLQPQPNQASDLACILDRAVGAATLASIAAHEAAVGCWLTITQQVHRQLLALLQEEAKKEGEAKVQACTRLQALVMSVRLGSLVPSAAGQQQTSSTRATMRAALHNRSPRQLMMLFEQPSYIGGKRACGCCCSRRAKGASSIERRKQNVSKQNVSALALATTACANLASVSWHNQWGYTAGCRGRLSSACVSTVGESTAVGRSVLGGDVLGVGRGSMPSREDLECVIEQARALGLTSESGLMKAAMQAQRRIQVRIIQYIHQCIHLTAPCSMNLWCRHTIVRYRPRARGVG
jgi:hypothetical protein